MESLESPEPFPGSAWLGAGPALGRGLFSKAGLGACSKREGACRTAISPTALNTPPTPPRGHQVLAGDWPQSPQAVCPAVFTSPGHKALIYLGLENVVRHLDTHWVPAQNQHWVGGGRLG